MPPPGANRTCCGEPPERLLVTPFRLARILASYSSYDSLPEESIIVHLRPLGPIVSRYTASSAATAIARLSELMSMSRTLPPGLRVIHRTDVSLRPDHHASDPLLETLKSPPTDGVSTSTIAALRIDGIEASLALCGAVSHFRPLAAFQTRSLPSLPPMPTVADCTPMPRISSTAIGVP